MSPKLSEGMDWLESKVCPVCGKTFSVLRPHMWRFKYNAGNKTYYYCKYSCFMEAEKERDEMKKLTLEQKKKAIQIAVDDGNPFDFLEECGIHNVAEVWSKIKKNCKEMDPETYKKLPRRLPQRVRTVNKSTAQKIKEPKPEKVVLVEDPGIAEEYRAEQAAKPEGTLADAVQGMTEAADMFFGACEEMGLKMESSEKPKITRPVNYMGLDITAVRAPDLGEFYYDHKFNSIDWRFEGEEIFIAPNDWKRLLELLPTILKVLGVDPE